MLSLVKGEQREKSFRPKAVDDELRKLRRARFMIWDSKQRRYENDDGRPLTSAEVRKHIEEFIQSEKEQVRSESARLFDGEIAPADFFAFMRQKVTAWHGIAGVIAYGGEDEMDA